MILAALLVLMPVSDGLATTSADIPRVHTRVTIRAKKSGNRAISVWGHYNNISPRCPRLGRPVDIYVHGIWRARVRTGYLGRYAKKLYARHGRRSAQSVVRGSVRGGYGGPIICLDAVSKIVYVMI